MSNNKQEKLLKQIEIAIFWFIWIVVFISPIIAQNDSETIEWKPIIANWYRLSPFLIIALINHFLLVPLLFFRNRQAIYFVSILVVLSFSAYLIQDFQAKQNKRIREIIKQEYSQLSPNEKQGRNHRFDDRNNSIKKKWLKGNRNIPGALPPHINIGLIALLIIGFDTGLMTVFKWTQSEQKRTKLEKEHLNTQLAFLRNQVSPHFFMNTLNNIHALIDIDTDEAKDAVIQLSKLMRHLLYDSEAEIIPLKKELNFIQHYIDLMRLRFTEKVDIQYKVIEPLPECSIPPLLFTSFLENAFKHGVSYQADSFIHITISGNETTLNFNIKNSNPKLNKNIEDSGLGLNNSIKRLNLLYKDQYTLEVSDQSDSYSIHLTLPL